MDTACREAINLMASVASLSVEATYFHAKVVSASGARAGSTSVLVILMKMVVYRSANKIEA